VVDRISALPGTKNYGIPSVAVSMFCRIERLMDVPASCFYPEPKVVSSVLKMRVRERPLMELIDEAAFRQIVRLAFAQRRKTLLNNFRHIRLQGYSAERLLSALHASGIDGTRRAETLSAQEFGLLTNCFVAKEKA
jgi:16S rRNA (adenine1518-N6/adenine1519-N6)-dimethyltransferase